MICTIWYQFSCTNKIGLLNRTHLTHELTHTHLCYRLLQILLTYANAFQQQEETRGGRNGYRNWRSWADIRATGGLSVCLWECRLWAWLYHLPAGEIYVLVYEKKRQWGIQWCSLHVCLLTRTNLVCCALAILIDANDYECCYIRIEYAWVYLWKSTSRCCTNCSPLFAIKIDKYISIVDLTITSELRY